VDPRIVRAKRKAQRRPAGVNRSALERHETGEGSLAAVFHLGDEELTQLREHAVALHAGGKIEQARAVLELLIAMDESDAGILLLLAACCAELGDLDAARHCFRAGLEGARAAGADTLCNLALAWGSYLLEEVNHA